MTVNISEIINAIEMVNSYSVVPLYFFAYEWQLKDAIRFFSDTEIIVVDYGGNMWERGKKLAGKMWEKSQKSMEKCGDNYER